MQKKYFLETFFISTLLVASCFLPLASYEYYEDPLNPFSRYTFPTTCRNHFTDNITTAGTWIEADDHVTILLFSPYLDLIPQCYEADCLYCYDCGGVGFEMNRGWYDPVEGDGFDLLFRQHTTEGRELRRNCKLELESDVCEDLCWNGGYFRRWNHKYVHFFKHFLEYSSENKKCQCYWPELNESAANINDSVYELLKELAEENLLSADFSTFWKGVNYHYYYTGYHLYEDCPPKVKGIRTVDYYPNSHGMASSLTTYTFFYSQYHQMLLSVIGFIDSNCLKDCTEVIDRIYAKLEEIRNDFSFKYNSCLRRHSHPKIYYERGMLKMHNGDFDGAMIDVNRFMQLAEKRKNKLNLTSEMYQQEGEIYNELGMYDQAIQVLTQAIQLDPSNKGAYFNRAQAYFESGEFDLSIQDYMSSKTHETSYATRLKPSLEIKEAVLNGLLEGGKEAAIDFVPSLCRSAYGLGLSLWTFAEHPIDSTNHIINICYEIGQNINELCKNIDFTDPELYVEEFEKIRGKFDKLSDSEKSNFVGHLIGKYGVDIFSGQAALKGVILCKRLKDANRIANLEALAAKKSQEAIKTVALSHAAEREAFFKNVKLRQDLQNKHIPSEHNYQKGNSIFEHTDPQGLLNKFAGKGKAANKDIPGMPGYRERVDFGEFIGYYIPANDKTIKYPTDKGIIHYGKSGAHIIPSDPKGF